MPGYTIELDLTGRTVLLVGLGRVGRRKAAGLVEAGGPGLRGGWAAAALGPEVAGLARLLAELRPRVLALPDPPTRHRLLTDWADPRWLDLWAAAGPEAVRRALTRALADAAPKVVADGDS